MKVCSNSINDDAVSSKRIKLSSLCSHSSSPDLDNNVMVLTSSPENFSPGEFLSENSASRWCSHDSGEVVKERLNLTLVDLESNCYETESSTDTNNKFSGGEMNGTSLSSSLSSDSEETESPHRKYIPVEKVPTQAEIDEFFFEAEERERKRFADMFNYDIVRDVPLEGRFEWIRLKP